MSPAHVTADAVCTRCGCVCDDLRITAEAGRITAAERACPLAEPWLLGQRPWDGPPALVAGGPATLDEALDRAAAVLKRARAPLVYGLSRSNTEGQREAVALADRLGATVDTTASRGHAPSILALQEAGEVTCTLGEVKNRADLVIFWGSDPVESHPRHLERYALAQPGRHDPPLPGIPPVQLTRTLVVIDPRPSATAARADVVLAPLPGHDFELLWALRAHVRGLPVPEGAVPGVPLSATLDLARRMQACRFGVTFFGLGLARQGPRTVEALLRLGIDLNAHTRFHVRRMRVSGDVAGADSVLAWQTGYPFAVNLGRGYPRYNPGEFTGHEVLTRGEADAVLLLGSSGLRRFEAPALAELARRPVIVLDPPEVTCLVPAEVRFHTATPGLHTGGTVYRLDEVPLSLRPVLSSHLPTDAEVLRRLRERLG